MTDVLHEVLTKLGAVDSRLENLQERSDEDRKDNGRHRQDQREQQTKMSERILSIDGRVTRIEPIVEGLHKQGERKKFARDLMRGLGHIAVYIAPAFTSIAMAMLGWFDKIAKFLTGLMH